MFYLILISLLSTPIQMVRVKYSGGGDWYNDPSIIPNMMSEFEKRTGIPTKKQEVVLSLDDDKIFSYPILFITGHSKIVLSDKECKMLRRYIENGGFVYADDDYGMDMYIRQQIKKAFPNHQLTEVPFDNPIFHIFYNFSKGLPKIHEHYKGPPHGYGIFIDGRLSLFYTYNTNISDGWADPDVHKDPQKKREEAFKMGTNIIYYAITY